ncbi:ribonuclease H-like domain-containing protein [Pisolithus orientalis]|uniref:ribonuclease H-like domain-containing protein n=1 Tax=Pisolithus orientalis TaxID=936130 RepID=UPI0022244CDE|nr:ribonuclease H-like domain-containing protein [Pisolithus orientalis]KAI6004490.1 ribonuclease H-like domain-containing protein [Pisolithus orientalis]
MTLSTASLRRLLGRVVWCPPRAAFHPTMVIPKDQKTYPLYSWNSSSPSRTPLYITDHNVANKFLSALPHGTIGFDLEWKPGSNPVALVQLATANCVLLLHIYRMKEIPHKIRDVLSGSRWTKVGVNIQYDCKKLHEDYGLDVRNCVNLSLMARSVDNARWNGSYIQPIGLAKLLQTYHGTTLCKEEQLSNWELPLSPTQQHYAANDAHSAYTIYTRLQTIAQTKIPPPHPNCYSFSCVDGQLYDRTNCFTWAPKNPNYDPDPPPSPKDQDPENDQSPWEAASPAPTIADTTASLAGLLASALKGILSLFFFSFLFFFFFLMD